MIEKTIEAVPGYLIYLDNVRIDKYVKSWRTSIACDGSIGSATVDMIYAPSFNGAPGVKDGLEDGIPNMTNLYIFVKNVFNGKYIKVFEGNVISKNFHKANGNYSFSFSAVDYMNILNKIIVPLIRPVADQVIMKADVLKWKTKGIDVNKVDSLSSVSDLNFKNKTITQYIDQLKSAINKSNAFFSSNYSRDRNNINLWDNVLGKINIMGDIDPNLVAEDVFDANILSNATSTNTMFVHLNDITKNLMFEIYQDRDAQIRLKPPFWNQGVLYSHVIDSSLISDYNESTDYNNYVSRITAIGGVSDAMANVDSQGQTIAAPVLGYVGNLQDAGREFAEASIE